MFAENLRVAFFSANLTRKGPGLLLQDISRGGDTQIAAVRQVIVHNKPDILLLSDFDYDAELRALSVFNQSLEEHRYQHLFALRPNSGMATALDLNGDKRLGTPKDAQGFGYFGGQGGLALLSRFPIVSAAVQDFSSLLWKDLPDAMLPRHPGGKPFPSPQAQEVQRLSSVGHWLVPVTLPNRMVLTLIAYQAGPPIFDGQEDQNGKRNHDENMLWLQVLNGKLGQAPAPPFILLGGSNLDPADGDGLRDAIQSLLEHPALQDPVPRSLGAKEAANAAHIGDPALDTVDWNDPRPGNMRVDYVLPSKDIVVTDAGVFWPTQGTSGSKLAERASRHRLVWVDLSIE